MSSTITATPAIVRVHYRDLDGQAVTFTAALHADQHPGMIALVPNERAWQDPTVCRWQMGWDRITRVEVIRPGHEPSAMEHVIAALQLTRWEQTVLDALVDHGGPVQWVDVPEIVRHHAGHEWLTERQVRDILASLKHKGRTTLTPSAGLASAVVHLTQGA